MSTTDARATSPRRPASPSSEIRRECIAAHARRRSAARAAAASRPSSTALNRFAPRTPAMLSAASASRMTTSVHGAPFRVGASAGMSAPSASAKNDATAAVADGDPRPEHHAGEESDERTERDFDVRVESAGQRDATARLGEAEHDEPHRDRADDDRRAARQRRAPRRPLLEVERFRRRP